MRPKDIRIVLDSMTVLVDTREQDTERARWRYAAIGLPAVRCTLDYGDYSYNAVLPDGTAIYDVTGGTERLEAVEKYSRAKAEEMGMTMDEYTAYTFKHCSEGHFNNEA